MNLSKKQQNELALIKWFVGDVEITEADVKKFFDYSDRGIGKKDAQRALYNPQDYTPGFVALISSKGRRDLQVQAWKEDWGDTLNAWSFIDEPQFVVEWIAKVLDREAILMAWHENQAEMKRWYKPWGWKKARTHREFEEYYQELIDNKPFNKPMTVSRS